jgi:hypothetical protein
MLQGRWRILKAGIRVHGLKIADDIWYTCCALHNMLLNVDGLDKRWKKGVSSDFQGELGWHAVGDVEAYAPLIFRRVRSGIPGHEIRQLDLSENHSRDVHFGDTDIEEEDQEDEEEENIRTNNKNYRVLHMSNKYFRKKLVEHFHRRWSSQIPSEKIKWPSRTGKMAN